MKLFFAKLFLGNNLGFCRDYLDIHEVVGDTYEGLHSIKIHNKRVGIIKLELFKAYEKAPSLFIHLILLKICFSLEITLWITRCVVSTSFTVLINDTTCPFFKFLRGIG